jgi:hypothetical protein
VTGDWKKRGTCSQTKPHARTHAGSVFAFALIRSGWPREKRVRSFKWPPACAGWSPPVWWKIETDTVWSQVASLVPISTRRSMIFNALSSFPFSRRSSTARQAQPSADRSSGALAGCYSGYMCSTACTRGMTRDETRKEKDEPPASPVGCLATKCRVHVGSVVTRKADQTSMAARDLRQIQ